MVKTYTDEDVDKYSAGASSIPPKEQWLKPPEAKWDKPVPPATPRGPVVEPEKVATGTSTLTGRATQDPIFHTEVIPERVVSDRHANAVPLEIPKPAGRSIFGIQDVNAGTPVKDTLVTPGAPEVVPSAKTEPAASNVIPPAYNPAPGTNEDVQRYGSVVPEMTAEEYQAQRDQQAKDIEGRRADSMRAYDEAAQGQWLRDAGGRQEWERRMSYLDAHKARQQELDTEKLKAFQDKYKIDLSQQLELMKMKQNAPLLAAQAESFSSGAEKNRTEALAIPGKEAADIKYKEALSSSVHGKNKDYISQGWLETLKASQAAMLKPQDVNEDPPTYLKRVEDAKKTMERAHEELLKRETTSGGEQPPIAGAKKAPDGKWYVQDASGKYRPVITEG